MVRIVVEKESKCPQLLHKGERYLCLGECWIIVEGNVPEVEDPAHWLYVCLFV